MKQRIVVMITDSSVGVQDLPDDIEIEVRDYRSLSMETASGDQFFTDSQERWYIRHTFGRDD